MKNPTPDHIGMLCTLKDGREGIVTGIQGQSFLIELKYDKQHPVKVHRQNVKMSNSSRKKFEIYIFVTEYRENFVRLMAITRDGTKLTQVEAKTLDTALMEIGYGTENKQMIYRAHFPKGYHLIVVRELTREYEKILELYNKKVSGQGDPMIEQKRDLIDFDSLYDE